MIVPEVTLHDVDHVKQTVQTLAGGGGYGPFTVTYLEVFLKDADQPAMKVTLFHPRLEEQKASEAQA